MWENCPCKGAFLEPFIQPSILMYLNTENLHGFSIFKKLKDSNVMNYSGIDPTGIYRTLKKMEAKGLLTSEWDTESASQPRKIYSITDEGRECFSFWDETLTEYANTISKLSKTVSESQKKNS